MDIENIDNIDKTEYWPTKLCFLCHKYFKLEMFGLTQNGRHKAYCLDCLVIKKKIHQNKRKTYYSLEREKIREIKKQQKDRPVQKLNIEINSTNNNIDLKKIRSFTINFNE